MNPRLMVLALCLAGNGLLGYAWFRQGANNAGSAASTPNKPSDSMRVERASPSPVAETTTDSAATNSMPDFSWSQFATTNFTLYIEQLRTFGTPEPQVHEIILGAVNALYRPRRAALFPPKSPDDGRFWQSRNHYWFGPQSHMTKEQRAQLRALNLEQRELVKSLFGPGIYLEMAKESANDTGMDWMERAYGFLPPELREKVQDIEERMGEDRQEIYALNDGDWQFQQEDERKLEKKYHDELAKILSPEQLFEWDLRHSQTANQLKNDLSAFDPNEAEFRALFQYQQAMHNAQPPRDPDSDTPPTPEERKAMNDQKKAAEAALADALGTNRVAEYKLEQDYAFRSLIDAGVPKETVFKLSDIKKDAEAAAKKVRKDKTLFPDQRNDALAAIRTETQNTINGLLDEKQSKRYQSQGGWWINNLAPQPQPAAAP